MATDPLDIPPGSLSLEAITDLLDGSSNPSGNKGDVQFNDGSAFGNADSVAAGCVVNLDTFVGSGLEVDIVNGGAVFTCDLDFDVIANAVSFEAASGNVQFTSDTGAVDLNANGPSGAVNLSAGNSVNISGPVAGMIDGSGGQIFVTGGGAVVAGSGQVILRGTATSVPVNVQGRADGNLAFFSQGAGVAKQTVTGSKGGNAALTSLLSALAAYGLITDSTT